MRFAVSETLKLSIIQSSRFVKITKSSYNFLNICFYNQEEDSALMFYAFLKCHTRLGCKSLCLYGAGEHNLFLLWNLLSDET